MSSESIASSGTGAARRPLLGRVYGWLTTVDHKRLGILYILLALAFLVIGGIEATIMRIQLIRPLNDFVSPQLFNRMFTMHGTTMIFFVAMPLVFGFANYMVPPMIGARDMAFPRLNAFSFWMTAFGALVLYSSFLGGTGFLDGGNAPDVGWFAYAPLTSLMFSPGHSSDFWTLGLLPDDHLPPGFVMPAPNPREPIPEHEPSVGTIERGRYLSKMCSCQECHSPRTAGGGYVEGQLFQGGGLQMPLPDGHLLVAPNSTPDCMSSLRRRGNRNI